MPSLHVDPAVLRAAAASIETSLEALLPALPGVDPDALAALALVPGGATLVAEHDRLAAAVARTGRELTEFVAALGVVASGVELADHDAVRAIRDVDR